MKGTAYVKVCFFISISMRFLSKRPYIKGQCVISIVEVNVAFKVVLLVML